MFLGIYIVASNVVYADHIICPQNCGRTYKTAAALKKHLKYECYKSPQFKCPFCDKMTKRPDNLKSHMKLVHKYIPSSITDSKIFNVTSANVSLENSKF